MKKIFTIVLMTIIVVHAQKFVFDIKASLVGKIGKIVVQSDESKSKYSIDLKVKATGFAKSMSGNLVEHHTSHGSIKSGEYYAKEYKVVKSYKDIKLIKKYTFDYKKKKIMKITTKWKKGKKLYEKKKILAYFANNDVLTLYHNVVRFKKSHKAGHYGIRLAGAETNGGKILFNISKEKDYLSLSIHRSFFSGGKGTLALGIGADDIVNRGTLKSVKLLGTLTLYRIK